MSDPTLASGELATSEAGTLRQSRRDAISGRLQSRTTITPTRLERFSPLLHSRLRYPSPGPSSYAAIGRAVGVLAHSPRARNQDDPPLEKRDRPAIGHTLSPTPPARPPIALAARPSTSSRGFFPWRLSDADPSMCRLVATGRHLKPLYGAFVVKGAPASHLHGLPISMFDLCKRISSPRPTRIAQNGQGLVL